MLEKIRRIKMSRYDQDSQEISRISFDKQLNQKQKNERISVIERRMEKEDQLELNGKGTGYYD
jgi:hypothetical protein